MNYETLIFQSEKSIATITFNRPKVLNAINSLFLKEFAYALDTVAENEDIRVLVLTASGDRAFVAGADISELATLSTLGAKQFAQKGHSIINRIQALPIPVMAAVNGFALGGGNEIALACDFIYASSLAKFGFPEMNLGLIPGFGGTQRAPRAIGANRAKELVFTGKMITAEEAAQMGMVNKVCEPEKLMDDVMKTATLMASKGKVSLRAAKQVINNGLNVDLATGCSIETEAFALCFSSRDAKEGTAAFLEKRPAEFKGSLVE